MNNPKTEANEDGRSPALAVATCSAARLTHAEEISMLHVRCYGYASAITEMLAGDGIQLSVGQEMRIKHLLANRLLTQEWPIAGAHVLERMASPNLKDEPRRL